MVVHTRLRSFLQTLAIVTVASLAVAYFAWHAVHGSRGMDARRSFETDLTALKAELEARVKERQSLERQIARMSSSRIDRDLLDEETRRLIGWIHPNDRIIDLGPG